MSQNKFLYGPVIFLGILVVLFFGTDLVGLPKDLISGQELIQAERLLEQIRVLANPKMEGRAAGTAGGARAADYIAREFEKIGLKPAGDRGSYFQAFEITTVVRLGKKNRLTLEIAGEQKHYKPGVSFNPFGFSDEGKLSSDTVFAGYGITAPELQYDDYTGLKVRGKIVLVMTHEPRERDETGPFRNPETFRYTEIRYKVWNAREHGAKGILIVTDPNNHETEGLFAIRGGGSTSAGIFAVNISAEVAEALLSPIGKSLAKLQRRIDETLTPRPFPVPGVRVHIQTDLIREKSLATNVLGMLSGRGPRIREEAIVIGAHYDGLGRGSENSLAPDRYGEIHPGADDNASGVAGILALARAVARIGTKRTIIFAAFDAEEVGLLGSSHYVKSPPWPLDKTYVMINLDMIGRLKNRKLYLLGVDSAKEFRSVLDKAARGLNLELGFSGDGYGPSDQTPFYARERPVLMFFSGPHSDYHRPSDTADKINAEGAETILKLVLRTVAGLEEQTQPLTYVRTKGRPPRIGRSGRVGYGAYFGSIPDFAESDTPGVRLTGVRPGSPAEKAGLGAGDIIVKFGGMTIRNLEDLVMALRSKRAKDRIEIHYLRQGKELKGQATLEKRR